MAADRFVGRSAERAVLDELLSELAQGRPAAAAVVGEPGIGKTRLLADLAARADARGHLVLSGSASEFERDLPFWVFVDALDEYVAGLEPRRLDPLDADARAELGHLLPSLGIGSDGRAGTVGDARYRTHRAVRQLLEAIAAKPVVVLLDDLHWADSGSVELLGGLLRRPPAAPVLLAVAVRPRQVPDRLSSALERARRAGGLQHLELGPLSAEEARQLVGEAVDVRALPALYTDSGGNPFYLQQLARSLRRSPALSATALAGVPVPAAVAGALLEELDLLRDGDRRVLEGAAVAGDPFDPELAAAAAGTPEAVTMDALDELLRRDLVRPTEVPRRFRFRHPLVRQAVYEAAPGGWRLGAHERTADALAARGSSVTVRAHHVEQAARSGDLAAVAVLREAGDALLARTPAGAARWFAAALRLLPDTAPPMDRIILGTALARALAAAGQFSQAHAVLLDSLEVVPQDAAALRVRLTADCAGLEQILGQHRAAHARLLGGLERLSDPGSPEAVLLMLELAADCAYRMEYRSMRDWSQRALDAAGPLGDPLLTARAAARLALASTFCGSVDLAETACAEATRLIETMPDEELAPYLERAAISLAAAELYLDRYEEAGRHAEHVVAVAQATGRSHQVPLLFWVGAIRLARGRLAEATEVLDTAVEIARLSGNRPTLARGLLGRSFAATAAGEVETALATAQESMDLLQGLDHSLTSAWAAYALAAALLPVGEPARAIAALADSAGGDDLALLPANPRVGALELLTHCWLALGRREQAGHAAARAEASADALGLRSARAVSDRAAAALALHLGDPSSAAVRALGSVAAAESVGAVVEAALSRMLAGRALARAGESQRAVTQFQEAAAVFETCGATQRRDSAERELRQLGHRTPHRRSRPGTADGGGLASLTERELEVARLVVDRRTNAQIAATLFLSQKTVETHLRNLFHKLAVSSRVEVARVIERADRQRPR
jgi:ATP/maltotriose-dependent transcriptional regulator MalT